MHFVLLRTAARPILVGSVGYKGPPDETGTVEIGYGIVSVERRAGFATEAAGGLVPAWTRVIAETLPELEGSIGVLRKCGFRLLGEGSEPGVIRFELT
jgi:ribosomal-protein-alanine N-acetyltransferase